MSPSPLLSKLKTKLHPLNTSPGVLSHPDGLTAGQTASSSRQHGTPVYAPELTESPVHDEDGTSHPKSAPQNRRHPPWSTPLFSRSLARHLFRSLSSSPPVSPVDRYDVSTSVTLLSLDPVARGGFCDLYLGKHVHYGQVALRRPRCFSPDGAAMRRFRREIQLLCSISHPNILPFIGHCIIGNDLYMVSPYIENGDLLQWIQQEKELNRLKVLLELAEAVAHLHQLGLIHGDIKAANVLLSDKGAPLLCDFGLAKFQDSMATSASAKGSGSLRWMAPELFDDAPKTKDSDVYAFGMMIAEVLKYLKLICGRVFRNFDSFAQVITGRPPLSDFNAYAVVVQVYGKQTRPERPDYCFEGSYRTLWDVAEKCWVTNPWERPPIDRVVDWLKSEKGKPER